MRTVWVATGSHCVRCINCDQEVIKNDIDKTFLCKNKDCEIEWICGKARYTFDDHIILIKPPKKIINFVPEEKDHKVRKQIILARGIKEINNIIGFKMFYDHQRTECEEFLNRTKALKEDIHKLCWDLLNNKNEIVDRLLDADEYKL
jgi:hypothetical protein